MTCSKFSNFGTPRSKFHAFGTPQPGWDPSRATTRACTRGDPSRSGMATRTGRAQRRSAQPQHATRRRRGRGLRVPRVPRRPERPAPRSGTPPGGPLALTACETARCQCRSTAGQRQGAWPRSVPGPATRGPGCSPPPRSAPRWTRCPTTAAYTRGMLDDGGAGGSKQPWSARGYGGADVGQGPIARLLRTQGPSIRFAVTLPNPDTP